MAIRPSLRERVEGSQIAGRRREWHSIFDVSRPEFGAEDRNDAQVRLDAQERMDMIDAESDADFGMCE